MKNIILGDGISAYITAACLEYLGKENIEIYGVDNYKAPSIMYLKYDNESQLKTYFDIFGILDCDLTRKSYLTEVKVGFLDDNGVIHKTPTESMVNNYYTKQGRYKTKSSMSDGLTSYKAIRLDKVYKYLVERFYNRFHNQFIDDNFIEEIKEKNCNIYNTIKPTLCNNNITHYEYLKKVNLMPNGFDYVYDCRLNSNIKRYTINEQECINFDGEECIKIKNYYDSPTIYSTYDVKNNIAWYDIGRSATKTQVKQEDIIKYFIGEINE